MLSHPITKSIVLYHGLPLCFSILILPQSGAIIRPRGTRALILTLTPSYQITLTLWARTENSNT